MNHQLKQKSIEALEKVGFDTSITAGQAIDRFIDSIPHFTKQDRIMHDLCHIFANGIYGSMDEEDPTFILQSYLSDVSVGISKSDREEYRKIVKSLQERAQIIKDFFQTLTGIEQIAKINNEQLKSIPLCMFGVVPDNKPLIYQSGKFPYRLMSAYERARVIDSLSEATNKETHPIGEAIAEAPERINLFVAEDADHSHDELHAF